MTLCARFNVAAVAPGTAPGEGDDRPDLVTEESGRHDLRRGAMVKSEDEEWIRWLRWRYTSVTTWEAK